MKTEMSITVHQITVIRKIDGNLLVQIKNENGTILNVYITKEESANLETALSMINLISESV